MKLSRDSDSDDLALILVNCSHRLTLNPGNSLQPTVSGIWFSSNEALGVSHIHVSMDFNVLGSVAQTIIVSLATSLLTFQATSALTARRQRRGVRILLQHEIEANQRILQDLGLFSDAKTAFSYKVQTNVFMTVVKDLPLAFEGDDRLLKDIIYFYEALTGIERTLDFARSLPLGISLPKEKIEDVIRTGDKLRARLESKPLTTRLFHLKRPKR